MPDEEKTAVPQAEPSPSDTESSPPAPPRWRIWAPFVVAALTPTLLFFVLPPLTRSGLWDPFELNVADLARRVALNLFHGASLALDGADNSLPHLNDLGRPQLPFSSIAVGFRPFGLHEWAGRLPLALWGLAGVRSTYAFVARLFDRRTGAYAAVVLSTMPLYFVQARSMLGDICSMSGLAMAFGGLAVATFDRDASQQKATPLASRLPWLGMAALGLLVGYESRGALLGLGVPLLGVGLAWASSRAAWSRGTSDRVGDVVGAISLGAGVFVGWMGARVISGGDSKDLNMWIGSMLHYPAHYPTFDFYVAAIGHALAPWSAFLPFAFGRLFIRPRNCEGVVAERESLARVALLVGLTVALVAHGYLAARTDLIAFSGPALCAVACAVALRDFERGAHASIAVGLGTLLFAAVLHHDFHELPEKAYQAFGVTGATFPESFKERALDLWWVVLGGFALCAFLTWVERDAERKPFDPEVYGTVMRTLREAYDGMLALVYFAVIAGASLAGALVWIGMKTHAHWMPQMSSSIRDVVLNAWWAVAFIPLAFIFGLLFACDLWLWAFGRSRPLSKESLTRGFEPFEELVATVFPGKDAPASRRPWLAIAVVGLLMLLAIPALAFVAWFALGFRPVVAALLAVPSGIAFFLLMGLVGDLLRHRAPGLALGGALVGFVLCFFYYPALANQLSPKEVFESYRQLCPEAPLALFGVGGRTSAYYAGGQPQTINDTAAAYNWLTAGGGQRRCLALKAEELPKLNQLWREKSPEPRSNLPIVDARSSQILLAASNTGANEKNQNPLSAMILSEAPHPQRRLDANMDDKLEVLGIDILDDRGKPVDTVAPGRAYHMKTYYKGPRPRHLGVGSTSSTSTDTIDGTTATTSRSTANTPCPCGYPAISWSMTTTSSSWSRTSHRARTRFTLACS